MPNFCAVVGCASRGGKDLRSFFRIPAIPKKGSPIIFQLKTKRRHKWIVALRRKNLTEKILKNQLICDKHFITGRPAKLKDVNHPDWVPSVLMGYETNLASSVKRYNRIKVRSVVDGTGQTSSSSKPVVVKNESLEDSYEHGTSSSIPAASSSTSGVDRNESLEVLMSCEAKSNLASSANRCNRILVCSEVDGTGETASSSSSKPVVVRIESLEDSYEHGTSTSKSAAPSSISVVGRNESLQDSHEDNASSSVDVDINGSLEDSQEEETNASGAEGTAKVNAETQTETRLESAEIQTDLRMGEIDSNVRCLKCTNCGHLVVSLCF